MSGCPTTKPVDEGIDAFCQGIPRAACPYAPGTPKHRDWLCGWFVGRRYVINCY